MEYALKAALETQKEKLIFIEEAVKRILGILEPSNGTISLEDFQTITCSKCQANLTVDKDLFNTVTEIKCPQCNEFIILLKE